MKVDLVQQEDKDMEKLITDKEFKELGFVEDNEYKGLWSRGYNDLFPFKLYVDEDGYLIGWVNVEYDVVNAKNKIRATERNVRLMLEMFCPEFR